MLGTFVHTKSWLGMRLRVRVRMCVQVVRLDRSTSSRCLFFSLSELCSKAVLGDDLSWFNSPHHILSYFGSSSLTPSCAVQQLHQSSSASLVPATTRASPGPTTTESLIPSNAHGRDVVTAAVSTTPKGYFKGPADGCEGVQAEAQAGGFVAELATCLVEHCDA